MNYVKIFKLDNLNFYYYIDLKRGILWLNNH